ncbi:hypothetical protein SAMN02745121_00095 [Nannocystis exedens]|uniref:Carboxypeptidase regulatory-like domain-containing protein n=1 Tax=Nannocystis exedens TaxID=54 RepID=A0A1I1SKT3_9BACT|nr:hypothetical protein [Nannocystis exedens]PCC75555.1 hypothetical protein NAEX_08666 [Nannocystis exedens]SFD46922.1 hypothetical protein SAMN02745121_00095 [Nannocystis exedens]
MKRTALAAALLGAACSTAAPDKQDRSCMDDTDCLMGQVCNNNICYENDLPPRDGIAIDVQTAVPPFRLEIFGNDTALQRILDRLPNRYYIDRAQVRDRLRITLLENQLDDLEEGTGMEVPVAASIELQQPSRFARSPFVVTDLSFPPPTLDGATDPDPVLFKAWPRYDAAATDAHQPLYAKLTYQDDVGEDLPFQWGRGIVARQLMRKKTDAPIDDEFEIRTVRECHRRVLGNIRFPDGPLATEPPLEPPATVVVNMRHAGRADDGDPETPVCDPNPMGETPATCSVETIVNPPYHECSNGLCPDPYVCYPDLVDDVKRCGCKRDSECPEGQVCRVDLQQCALDLTDRPAIKQLSAEAKDDATVSAWVYTYCDEDPTADRTMEFIVSAAPDARLGLPRLNFRVVLTFLVGDLKGSTPLGRICLPTWERPVEVLVPLSGKPARLFEKAEQEWTCCDTSCLAEAATKPPPEAPTVCMVKPPITVVGNFAVPDPATWAAAACMPLSGADEQGNVRVTYGSADCDGDGDACSVNLSPGPGGGSGQAYTLRVEPPVGSLFRSTLVPVTITSDSTALPETELQPRVLLRGTVTQEGCTGTGCVPAEILAERVILGEDPETLLGPYFYNTTTTLGEFVLPVNPGVYLVTALPTVTPQNSAIGPAPIVVVDLREDNPDLLEEDGLLVFDMDPSDDTAAFTLTDGAVYTIELDDFVSNSRVIPLDLTSGEGLLHPDGEPLDLNAPGTCLPGEGCQIRRIRPVSSPLRVPQNQIVRFVARAAAAAAE